MISNSSRKPTLSLELFKLFKTTLPWLELVFNGSGSSILLKAEMALRLGTYFSISAQFWMNLQQHYDLEVSKDLFEKQIKNV